MRLVENPDTGFTESVLTAAIVAPCLPAQGESLAEREVGIRLHIRIFTLPSIVSLIASRSLRRKAEACLQGHYSRVWRRFPRLEQSLSTLCHILSRQAAEGRFFLRPIVSVLY